MSAWVLRRKWSREHVLPNTAVVDVSARTVWRTACGIPVKWRELREVSPSAGACCANCARGVL